MKRMIWSSIAVIVLAAAVAIPVIAQPPQGGGGRGFGRGGPGHGAPLPILRELNLTDAQREQVRALAGQRRGQADDPRRKVADLERQLQLAVFADAQDSQKIGDLKNAIAAATAEELTSRVELQTHIAEILTPEQRAQAREALGKSGGGRGAAAAGRRGRVKV